MTTPDERTRSLGWGWELLGEIERDVEVPSQMRERARDIALTYPSPSQLESVIVSQAPMPSEWPQAFLAARGLFREIQFEGAKSDAMRTSLLSTLRHFPNDSTIDLLARLQGNFARWLAPDQRLG